MSGCLCVLPAPSQLPSLRQLSVSARQRSSHEWQTSVATILPQLTRLCYRVQYDNQGVAAVLSGSGQPLDSLTELEVSVLNGEVATAVARHCPQLKRIEADYIRSAGLGGGQWAVQELAILKPFFFDSRSDNASVLCNTATAYQLAFMPRAAPSRGGEGKRLRVVRPRSARTEGRLYLSVLGAEVGRACMSFNLRAIQCSGKCNAY